MNNFYLLSAVVSIVIALIGYIVRTTLNRIESLEKRPVLDEDKVRILIADKLDPIKEDIKDIKTYVIKIIESFYIPPKK